jgi:signal peptidase I
MKNENGEKESEGSGEEPEEIVEEFKEEDDIGWDKWEADWEEEVKKEKEAFRRKCLRYVVAAAIYVGFLALFFLQARFVVLDSPSIPYKVCLQIFHWKPQKGDLCAFEKHGLTLFKYIAAAEGDDVASVKGDIYINNQYVCHAERTETLTPVRSFFVPSGYVFVLGTREDSLDSRYEEFGLVRLSDIRGKAIGLWKW